LKYSFHWNEFHWKEKKERFIYSNIVIFEQKLVDLNHKIDSFTSLEKKTSTTFLKVIEEIKLIANVNEPSKETEIKKFSKKEKQSIECSFLLGKIENS
jgi:hypothetical protein